MNGEVLRITKENKTDAQEELELAINGAEVDYHTGDFQETLREYIE